MTDHDRLVNVTDEELVERARGGCAVSFGELVRRYQVPIHHFLRRKCNAREEAEDLTQETFLRAYRKLGSFRVGARFRPWIFTVAYRVALNACRRKRACTLDDSNLLKVAVSHDQDQLESDEQQRGIWDVVQAAVTPLQFTVLWLFYVEQLSARDIGRVIAKSEGAVKTILCRARKAVMPRLRGFVIEPDSEFLSAPID